LKFAFYALNTSVPERDGASPDPYGQWLEQIDAAMVTASRAIFGGLESCVRHLSHIRDVVRPTHVDLLFHLSSTFALLPGIRLQDLQPMLYCDTYHLGRRCKGIQDCLLE
jgi:hypothetical protein